MLTRLFDADPGKHHESAVWTLKPDGLAIRSRFREPLDLSKTTMFWTKPSALVQMGHTDCAMGRPRNLRPKYGSVQNLAPETQKNSAPACTGAGGMISDF